MLIRLTQVTAIFGIGHCFRKLVATTNSGNLRQAEKHEMTMTTQAEIDLSRQIIGEQLSGVTFVMDYLQLQFNPPPIINAYTPVTVCSNGKSCVSGDDQFRNVLCEQITKIVKSVAIRDEDAFLI